jgi:class 3 adenylate cyclase
MRREAAITLGNIGRIYQSKSMPDSALHCFSAAHQVFLVVNDSNGIARMLGNMGNIYDIKGDFARALNLKFSAKKIYSQLNDRSGLARIYNNIAYSYLYATGSINNPATPDSLKNRSQLLSKSKYFIDMAIQLNRSMGNQGWLVGDYRTLTDIFYEMGDYKSSLLTYYSSVTLKDSIFSDESARKLTAMEVKRAEDVKQKEIEIKNIQIQNIKKERWYYITGISIVLVFAWLIFRGYKYQRKTNRLLSLEKQKSDDLLLNILPSEVAEELKDKGFTTAKQFSEVTVLFSDIVNFTQLSEQLGAGELVKEINTYFSAFDEIMTHTGLEKIKTIGDAYIAADGLKQGMESSPSRVIETALALKSKIEELKNIRIASDKPYFDFRIGIHTGPVVAGVVGVKKFQYDIWGDTVNTAARMESSGEAGKINISGVTWEAVKDKYLCDYRGKIEAKHKEPIDMYFVTGIA